MNCCKLETRLQGPSAKELDAADKLALQGYGRPYVGGKPGPKPSLGESAA